MGLLSDPTHTQRQKNNQENTGSYTVYTRQGKSARSKWISPKAQSDNEWELAIKTPLCTQYTNVPTFPHTCFDMQIAMKEI